MSTFRQSANQPGAPIKAPPLHQNVLFPTLPLQIAEQIAEAIISERYPPDARLKETELATAFGVSRSTVREALRLLEMRNLVRISPQRGAQITSLSPDEMEDLFEVRTFLVGLIARRVAARADTEILAQIQAIQARLEASVHNPEVYAAASAQAAIELARLSRSDNLVQLLTSFAQQLGRYARLGLQTEARRNRSIQLWRKLFKAIRDKDPQQAETLNRQLADENRRAVLIEMAARKRES